VTQTTSRETEDYFHSRPRGSQIAASIANQSPETTKAALEAAMLELEERYEGRDVPVPRTWGGFRVTPATIEYWQGRPNRLHDRVKYTKSGDGWKIARLAP
jgi:pyridoxamine 5'-phosphate oxidase